MSKLKILLLILNILVFNLLIFTYLRELDDLFFKIGIPAIMVYFQIIFITRLLILENKHVLFSNNKNIQEKNFLIILSFFSIIISYYYLGLLILKDLGFDIILRESYYSGMNEGIIGFGALFITEGSLFLLFLYSFKKKYI